MKPPCVVCSERPQRYVSSGECARCYQRRYYVEEKALISKRPTKQRRAPEWKRTGVKHCRLCNRTLPIARFGMQKNGAWLKPYSYCIDCRTWKNHERVVLRSRRTTKRGRNWYGMTMDDALQKVFEKHWERIA